MSVIHGLMENHIIDDLRKEILDIIPGE